MANVKGHITVSAPTSLEKKYYKVVYDFDLDGGAASALNLVTFASDCIITDYVAHVDTACTSTGSATLTVGTTDDTNAFEATAAVATLTAGAVFAGDLAAVKVASGDNLLQTIATEVFATGKITYMFGVVKAGL